MEELTPVKVPMRLESPQQLHSSEFLVSEFLITSFLLGSGFALFQIR